MNTRFLDKWRLVVALGLVLMLLLGGVGSAFASDIRSGDSIIIGKGQVIDDDLLVFGNRIVIEGTVNGDLIAFGNDITLNGIVNGSAVLGGQSVNVGGHVKGSLYSGGSALNLTENATVERNVMFGGYSLQTELGSLIARDLLVGGAQATLAGKVGRDLRFGGNALELNGTIGRDAYIQIAEPNQTPTNLYPGPNLPPAIASGLRVAKNTTIGGQLNYTSGVEQANEILATPTSGVVFHPSPIRTQDLSNVTAYTWLFDRARDLMTVLIVGLLALWAIPGWLNAAVVQAQTEPLAATGWGLVVLIVGGILTLFAFVAIAAIGIVLGVTTLGGLALATFGIGFSALTLIATSFAAVVVWGTKVIVSLLIGKILLQRFAPEYASRTVIAFIVGLVLFEIAATIPVLGMLTTIVAALLGLGAIWLVYAKRNKTFSLPMPKPAPLPA